MKKTILIFAALFTIVSCSKEDEGEQVLEPSWETVRGYYYIKEIIKPDGTLEAYNNPCTTKKDSISLWMNGFSDRVYFNRYYSNCNTFDDGCSNGQLYPEGEIKFCNAYLNGFITRLTRKTLRLEYQEVRQELWYQNGPSKGIVLQRFE